MIVFYVATSHLANEKGRPQQAGVRSEYGGTHVCRMCFVIPTGAKPLALSEVEWGNGGIWHRMGSALRLTPGSGAGEMLPASRRPEQGPGDELFRRQTPRLCSG